MDGSTQREAETMKTQKIQIVDFGRGPQIEGRRLTVMDISYYLHRGRDFEFIHRALPSLTREEFDAVVEYVNEHCQELVEEDRRVDERIQRGIAGQKTKGLYRHIYESVSVEERAERLKEKVRRRRAEQAEKKRWSTC
jgi:uncharacterized protein (DUF433 family)